MILTVTVFRTVPLLIKISWWNKVRLKALSASFHAKHLEKRFIIVLGFWCGFTIDLFYTLTWLFWRLAKKNATVNFQSPRSKVLFWPKQPKTWIKFTAWSGHSVQGGKQSSISKSEQYTVPWSSILCRGSSILISTVYCSTEQYTALVPDWQSQT